MQLENSFQVGAPPDRVFAYLLDINKVVGCVPGAELTEVVDASTFKGKVKIKVGPITVAYNGTARIVEKDEERRVAILEASGKETTGPGSAQARATMTVTEQGPGSTVVLATDYTVAGRVANFGRGVMEDVSRRLVTQMADCIKQQLEGPHGASSGQETALPAGAASEVSAAETPAIAGGDVAAAPAAAPPAQAKPVNALSLFFAVLWDRIKRLFGGGSRS